MPELHVPAVAHPRRALGASIVLFALILATVVGYLLVGRPMPTLAVDVEGAEGPIQITGSGFEAGDVILLTWDGAAVDWLPAANVGDDGTFAIQAEIPDDVHAGSHTVAAIEPGGDILSASVGVAFEAPIDVARDPFMVAGSAPAVDEPPELSVPRSMPRPTDSPTPGPVASGPSGADADAPAAPSAQPPATPPMGAGMPGVGDHGNPLHCMGYPEPRSWIESQDWWAPIPELGGLGHIHMGMCFPLGQTVSGVVAFDVRVVLHRNAGTLTRIKMQDDNSKEHLVLRPNQAVGDGTYWYRINIDTRNMPDGLRLFRFYADLEHPNGNTQTARPILPLRVENGGADKDWSDRSREVRATAWYREASPELDWGYVGAVVQDFDAGPHATAFSAKAKCFVNGEDGGEAGGSPAIVRWSAHIDPDFHAGNDGIVLGQGPGELSGAVTVPTAALSEGWHRLVVRCTQELGDREHSAVGVYAFLVDR